MIDSMMALPLAEQYRWGKRWMGQIGMAHEPVSGPADC